MTRRSIPGARPDGHARDDAPRGAVPSEVGSEVVAECAIERLAAGGDGIGRWSDGRTLFVPGTAPGDRVRVALVESHPRFVRGRVEALLEPGPGRVTPRCEAFGECGGCSWQHLDYPVQVEAKAAILRDALVRIGGLRPPDPLAFRPSPRAYAYRLRARLRVEGGAAGYRRRRSHAHRPVAACPVLEPSLERALVRPDRPDGEWEIAAGEDGRVHWRALGPGAASGPPIELSVEGRSMRVSAGAFAQANRALLAPLARAVRAALERPPAPPDGLLLELFAGAGFFTLACADRFLQVIAVESGPEAAADLRFNLERAGWHHVAVRRERGEAALETLARRGPVPDAVLLDPPRGGLGRPGALALARLAPRRVVYVSCDPATLARDLRVLADEGYVLAAVEGFDLFPQTPHVEAVAVLDRTSAG